VLNREAVELAVRLGIACGCEFSPVSSFARKNYFYPDLPKGYQITQYEAPLCRGGHLLVDLENGTRRFDLIRIHLEEDAGKLLYPDEGPATGMPYEGIENLRPESKAAVEEFLYMMKSPTL